MSSAISRRRWHVCLAILGVFICWPSVASAVPTAAQIDAYLLTKSSPLAGSGAVFYAQGQQWGVDPAFIVALAGAETSFGVHLYSFNGDYAEHNAWNWFWASTRHGSDFVSWAEGIQTVTKYVGSGGSTYHGAGLYSVGQIAPVYCPEGTSNWIANVSAFMIELGANPNDTRWNAPPTSLGIGWYGPSASAPVLACEDTSLWTKVTPVSNVGSVWYEATYFGASRGVGQAVNTDAENFRYTWWPPLNTSLKVKVRAVAYDKAGTAYAGDYTRYITEELYSVAGDFTGDGFDDVVRLIADGNNTQLWLFRSDGQRFAVSNAKTLSQWGRIYTKAVSGDVNGDGADELLLFTSGSGADFGQRCQLYVLDYASGTFTARMVWQAASGWSWERVKPTCGDVDADGKDEMVALYDYDGAGGLDTGLFTWQFEGTSASAKREWAAAQGDFDWNACNVFSGDFDGNGADEVGTYYRYGSNSTGWITGKRKTDGTWSWTRVWKVDTGWEFARTKPAVGDFDADGRDEVANFYDYDGAGGLAAGAFVMNLNADGTVSTPCRWTTPTGSWEWMRVRPMAGDFDRDGKDELSCFYDYHWNAETTEAWGVMLWRPEWNWASRRIWNKPGGTWGASTPTVSSAFADKPPAATVSRLAGGDRYTTSIAVSKRAFPGTAPAVVVATGANFPDALCAAPLARAYGGPVLLTPTASLTSELLGELRRLAPKTVFIVGSGSVVSPKVQSQLAALPSKPTITRLGGADRYATSAKVAAQLKARLGSVTTAVVTTGGNFPDALSAAPLAAAKGWPVLLTTSKSLSPTTASAIASLGVRSTVVVGSESVVSAAVASRLPSPIRKGGADRYATCAVIVDYAKSQGLSLGYIGFATGASFPDALSAGPLVASRNGVLLLTAKSALPNAVASRISANKTTVHTVDVIGGTAVVPQARVDQVRGLLR